MKGGVMEEEHIEKTVLAYLKRKGFKHTELAFHDEQRHHQQQHTRNSSSSSTAASQTDPDIEKCILAFSESESGPVRYHDGYSRLRSWAYSSLDLYRHELLHVLYPVFIHCFMDLVSKPYLVEARSFFTSFREDHEMTYIRDLQKLEGVLSPSHLQEMEFAHSLRHTKANVRLCQYSYELLLQYLQKTKSLTILGIINEHISFHVYPGPPGSALDTSEAVSLFACGHEASVGQINQTEVHWGLLEETYMMEERVSAMVSEADKVDDEGKEVELEENGKKRCSDGKKENVVVGKKVKKDKGVGGGLGKAARPETAAVSSVITNATTSPRVKAELPLPLLSLDAEKSILDDLRNRVQLTSTALPSVSFYTFVNAYGALNCASISQDGSMVAGGFSDSAVKVWDMARLEEDGGDSPQDENDSITLDSNGKKRPYKLFLGHSGPVYSTSFSPEGDFVLSSSSDSTVRLWSTELSANLVCYKGHNYPVWDVQYSPVGHYFASASHDRTARIWSMDRIHPLRICAGHLSDVDCVQWHVNCNYIVTGSSDKTVRMWDVQGGECVRIFVGHRGMILSLAVSPDGRYVASGDEDGMIMMWDISSGRHITPLIGHGSCVWALSFSREGSILASGSADCTVKLWDVTTSTKAPRTVSNKMGTSNNRLRSLKSLMTKSTSVYSLCFSRRNLLFAAGPYQKI